MKKILVPTDFSKSADVALEYAAKLALKGNIELVVLNGFDITFLHPDAIVVTDFENRTISEELIADKKTWLETKYSGLKVATLVECGSPMQVIVRAVEEISPDMIIMGTKGAHGVVGKLFGSVTSAVLKSINIPLLAIPKTGLEFGTNIGFATDYSSTTNTELKFIVDFAELTGASLKIFTVSDEAVRPKIQESREGLHFESIIGERVKHDYGVVLKDDVIEGVEEYLHSHPDIGVLTLIKHERRDWLEAISNPSISKKMLKQSDLATLILH